jgi:DNA-binding NarL/FixJ family response regulator
VRRVHAGAVWFDSELMARSLERTAGQAEAWQTVRALLTDREIDVVRLVAKGWRNRAIADALHLSEGTVKVHLHNVFAKLNLENRVELARYAERVGLV